MNPVLKFLIFFTFFVFMGAASFWAYKFLNNKIIGSRNGWQLIVYSLLLVFINVLIFFGGLWAMVKVYTSL